MMHRTGHDPHILVAAPSNHEVYICNMYVATGSAAFIDPWMEVINADEVDQKDLLILDLQ